MDSRDKPSVSFKASDGMSGKQDKSKIPAARGPNKHVDYSGPAPGAKKTYSPGGSATGVGSRGTMSSSTVGGRTRATHNQRGA